MEVGRLLTGAHRTSTEPDTPTMGGEELPGGGRVSERRASACTSRAQENEKRPETTRTDEYLKPLCSKGFRRFFKTRLTPCSSLIRMRSLVQIQVGPRYENPCTARVLGHSAASSVRTGPGLPEALVCPGSGGVSSLGSVVWEPAVRLMQDVHELNVEDLCKEFDQGRPRVARGTRVRSATDSSVRVG
jgi:hypothetical protein